MKFTRIVKNLCETTKNSKSEQNKKAQKDKTEKSAKKRPQTASAFLPMKIISSWEFQKILEILKSKTFEESRIKSLRNLN